MYYPYSEPFKSLGKLDKEALQHLYETDITETISASQKEEFIVEDEGPDYFIKKEVQDDKSKIITSAPVMMGGVFIVLVIAIFLVCLKLT